MADTTYTTKSGDMWDLIAYRAMGAERYMSQMIDANPAHRFTARFDAGVILVVPAVPLPVLPSSLPPWKRPL